MPRFVFYTWMMASVVGCWAHDATAADAAGGKISRERINDAIAKIEKLAEETIKSNGAPGIAITVVHQDEVIYSKGFGVREAGKPELVDADTVFQIASMSKPLTSTVLARMVGQKEVDWDDRIADHDPGFVMFDPYVTHEVRLRDMLCHRSGLPAHAGDLLEDIGYSKDEILHRLRYQPPSSSFRAGYAYTNFGFSEAGYAAAKAVGKSWNDVAVEKLFKPLGMTSTSYQFADYEKAKNRAKNHVLVDGKWATKYIRQPDAQAPAGGASSNIKDLAQWMRLHLAEGKFNGTQVVEADALAETHTPQFVTGYTPAEGRIGAYGLGWNVNDERGGLITLNHSGEFSLGVRSQVALIPIEGLGITVLSNGAPTGVPEGISQSFFDYVLDGELQREWMKLANQKFAEMTQEDKDQLADYSHPPSDRAAPLNLKSYAGKYKNDLYGIIEIAEKQSGLVLRSGPKLNEFKLRHWDRDLFTYEPTGESAAGTAGVMFTIGPEGEAERVSVENLNLDGQGVFEKVD